MYGDIRYGCVMDHCVSLELYSSTATFAFIYGHHHVVFPFILQTHPLISVINLVQSMFVLPPSCLQAGRLMREWRQHNRSLGFGKI